MPIQWNKWGNETLIQTLEKELPQSTLYWLIISICLAWVWVIYISYYNARVLGLILTLVLNRINKYGHIQFGSFSISVLSGKIMFRDVHYITENYALRIQLGYAIFRWWRPLTDKKITDDLSHSETRLSIYLDSFELNIFNCSGKYSELEELFGLDKLIVPPADPKSHKNNEAENGVDHSNNSLNNSNKDKDNSNQWQWRDLLPVIKFDISSGKFIFGNPLIPNSLCIIIGDSNIMYTTKPASTPFDQFMHIIKCKADNIRMMVMPSSKYQGIVDEPPRYMGDGFTLLQSSDVDIYHYYDEPGAVPSYPELVELANGDVIARRTWPCWGMDVKCGKGTDIYYGPWADRQREHLWKFFYPATYETMQVTKLPDPGNKRIWKSFDFKMSMQADSTFEVLFSKEKETQAVHMNLAPGSYLEFAIPMLTEETGYVSKINGQFLHFDATSSLPFRQVLDCETFEFDVQIKYPRHWNEHQDWNCNFTACKAAGYFIFQHKCFFQDLIEDWSTKTKPDLLHFIPYTMRFNLMLKEFELMTLANEWNWVDCVSQTPENSQIAFCGETVEVSFSLPFIDYLPPTVPLKFFIKGEKVDCRLFLPECNTSQHILTAIAENMKVVDRDGNLQDGPFVGEFGKQWRKITQKSAGWVDCWTTPIVGIGVTYTYHPCPTHGLSFLGTDALTDLSTPDAEERLLIPLRSLPLNSSMAESIEGQTPEDFDASEMEADLINVEVEIGPSVLAVYGSLLRYFYHVKENYFGEDQKFVDFETSDVSPVASTLNTADIKDVPTSPKEQFDPRNYRPFSVKVQASFHNIQAHLVNSCSEDDPPCPVGYVEKIVFELDKNYMETKLQVLVAPVVLYAFDNYEKRADPHKHLSTGHLELSGLQVRGHALFSHKDLPLEAETLEYGWLVEVNVGDITGRITAPQLHSIISYLQTFVFLIEDAENNFERAVPNKLCQHMVPQPECQFSGERFPLCPTSDDIKYRMTRVSVDCIDLYLVEAGTALNLQIYPVRLGTCNLHGKNNKSGITAVISTINCKQLVLSVPVTESILDAHWLEAGGISLGPVTVDAAMALPDPKLLGEQHRFLKHHDNRTKRLWFLWPAEFHILRHPINDKCGCVGGCRFFGKNRNGKKFFNPSDEDFVNSTATCVYNILNDRDTVGYGQSVLFPDHFVLNEASFQLPSVSSKHRPSLIDNSVFESFAAMPDMPTAEAIAAIKESMIGRRSHTPERITSSLKGQRSKQLTASGKVVNFDLSSDENAETMSNILPACEREPVDRAYSRSMCNIRPSERSSLSSQTGSITGSDLYMSCPEDVSDPTNVGFSPTPLRPPSSAFTSGSERFSYRSALSDLDHASRATSASEVYSYRTATDASGSEAAYQSAEERRSHYFTSASSVYQSCDENPASRVTSASDVNAFPFPDNNHPVDKTLLHQRTLSDTSLSSFMSAVSSQGTKTDGSTTPVGMDTVIAADHGNDFIDSVLAMDKTNLEQDTVIEQDSVIGIDPHKAMNSTMLPGGDSIVDMEHIVIDPHNTSYASISSASYAPSSSSFDGDGDFDANYIEQAANIIDLHGQINKPITQSPLLMSCYMTHMTQLRCENWEAPNPKPYQKEKPRRGSVFRPNVSFLSVCTDHNASSVPHLSYVRQGFSPNFMVDRKELERGLPFASYANADDAPDIGEAETEGEHVSKTTAIINLKGSVDVMVSPLMLEALQRFVEAVTPKLANLHPSSVLDALHAKCCKSVESQNKLEKCKDDTVVDAPDAQSDSSEQESRTSRLQVFFSLSKINVCLLQATLVEEMIAFSAIEKVKELTCVSMLALCVDGIQAQLLLSNRAHRPDAAGEDEHVVDDGNTTESGPSDDATAGPGEKQYEDVVGSLNIRRIHGQLRRMKRNSNFSDHVILTAIPEYQSKVLFSFQKQKSVSESPTPGRSESNSSIEAVEDIAGFIMFECGLEDIRLSGASRSGYQVKNEPNASMSFDDASEDLNMEGGSHLKGDATNAVLQFKDVWFNFAAPPPSPKKRKLDYTRLDWNLLSTATPAINSWMNPSHRLAVAIKALVTDLDRRISTTMACLMTEALEVQSIHMPIRSKFNKLTSLSKIMQEDPSCQLLTVLRRYMARVSCVALVEENLAADTMPALITIQRGLLALIRQWKHVLYMPILADTTFRSKRKVPYTVTFAIPNEDSLEKLRIPEDNADDISIENYDADEKTSLLKEGKAPSLGKMSAGGSKVSLENGEEKKKVKTKIVVSGSQQESPTKQPLSYKGSASGGSGILHPPPSGIMKRNESNVSFHSAPGSVTSQDVTGMPPMVPGASLPSTPNRHSLTKHLSELATKREDEDLYRWMQRQQESTKLCSQGNLHYYPSLGQDSLINTGIAGSEYSHDGGDSMSIQRVSMSPNTAFSMADAHVLFKPLLKGIGHHFDPETTSALMTKFGGNISVKLILSALRIDIVDSELMSHKRHHQSKYRFSSHRMQFSPSTPSFLCNNFEVMISMKDVLNFEKMTDVDTLKQAAMDERRKSMRTIKFAMDNMETKPATTKLNFAVAIQSVTQHVNMSLLRLAHQFVSVVENIHDTRVELKGYGKDPFRGHRKQDSKGSSTETDNHSMDILDPQTSNSNTDSILSPKSGDTNSRPDVLLLGASPISAEISMDSKTKFHLDSPGSDAGAPDISSPALGEKTIVDEIKQATPKCWKTLYHLLDLYSTMPETKTVGRKPSTTASKLSVIEEEPDKASQTQSSVGHDTHRESSQERSVPQYHRMSSQPPHHALAQSILVGEHVPLVVFGSAKISRLKVSAMLSGLKLEADVNNVNASVTHRETIKGVLKRKSHGSSAVAHVGSTRIILREGTSKNWQDVVTLNVATSQGLYSSFSKGSRGRQHNSGLLTVGIIDVDIPQHPVVLHDMVARTSKQISSTFMEFQSRPRVVPSKSKSNYDNLDGEGSNHHAYSEMQAESTIPDTQLPEKKEEPPRPFVIHFKSVLSGLTIGASLLPSLKARYEMGKVTSFGITGKKARFTVELRKHSLSFTSQVSIPSNVPSSASIDLPPIHMHADYRKQEEAAAGGGAGDGLMEAGLALREGSYLNAVAEVGEFRHSLTTDLLNHLVFVQKVFMKEVNEVVQKVSGGDQPVPLWGNDGGAMNSPSKPLLFSLNFRLKGIQITATTPSNNAVRLETPETIELKLSNRVEAAKNGLDPFHYSSNSSNPKLFVKLEVQLVLALGSLLNNPMFEEAEPEFQTFANFKTRISLRNALPDELIPGVGNEQEALLLSVKRPVLYVQPAAFDKAVLVWLNYKHAYDFWTEKRLEMNKEVQTATQQVLDKIPTVTANSVVLSTLFLQLTVDDLGICIPLNASLNANTYNAKVEEPSGAALVLTLEKTLISACSCVSLVSKGEFKNFCLRFAKDFVVDFDDWKPMKENELDPIMNAMEVPEGTYEVCSRTQQPITNDPNSNAKWVLNVKWKMEGIDIHLDTSIGKQLSILGNTLTAFAYPTEETNAQEPYSDESDGNQMEESSESEDDVIATYSNDHLNSVGSKRSAVIPEGLPDIVYDPTIDPKTRARLIEQQMNEQVKSVEVLKQLGASQSTIESEQRKLQELEAAAVHDFAQDFQKKLKRRGVITTVIKDTLGLGGNKPSSHMRSKSTSQAAPFMSSSSVRRSRERNRSQLTSMVEDQEGSEPVSLAKRFISGHQRTMSFDDHERLRTNQLRPMTDSSSFPIATASDTQASQSQTWIEENDRDHIYKDFTFRFDDDRKAESEKNMVEKERKSTHNEKGTSPRSTLQSQKLFGTQPSNILEPSVDFELDVKVDINSGSCILHPKEPKYDESVDSKPKLSPKLDRKNMKPAKKSMSDLNSSRSFAMQAANTDYRTVFFLPGVDIKIHYSSTTDAADKATDTSGSPGVSESTFTESKAQETSPPTFSYTFHSKKNLEKKANLYAWLTLQQLSEEMLISPSLLDFLDQALEPIPIATTSSTSKTSQKNSAQAASDSMDRSDTLDTSASSLTGSYGAVMGASFSVDVVVYIRVQASLIRFTCLPKSRVECLLRLPSLDVVFSTKKADSEQTAFDAQAAYKKRPTNPTSSLPKTAPTRVRHASGRGGSLGTGSTSADQPSKGGLSVTACMADFSLYIFHPYGGGKKTSLTALESSFRKTQMEGRKDGKDSLSLNVEFVKVNISRTRGTSAMRSANMVRFSAVCDIGSASFKYDMRKLSEILALPNAWYKKSLARRMFLGEEVSVVHSEAGIEREIRSQHLNSAVELLLPKTPSKPSTSSLPSVIPKIKTDLVDDEKSVASNSRAQSPRVSPSVPITPSTRMPWLSDSTHHKFERLPSKPATVDRVPGERRAIQDWETMVLFAVNLSKLDVVVNMSNVMGHTIWSTMDIKSSGQLSIDSTGYRNMKIRAGLGESKLEARGGIISGNILIQKVNNLISISEDKGFDPVHNVCLELYAVEARLDYMGSSIMMGRLSQLTGKLWDEWKIDMAVDDRFFADDALATNRPALIFVHGDLAWDKFHLMISRSTTPDLLKIVTKLDEFFTQQFTSSKRVFSVFADRSSSQAVDMSSKLRLKRKDSVEETATKQPEIRHQRHWQKVLSNISGCKFPMLNLALPDRGTILGGSMNLHGNNLSLACFSGINFRSKYWALFMMDQPYINFATEAMDVDNSGKIGTHIIQNLTFELGRHVLRMDKSIKAMVCKISRGQHNPQLFTSVADWFHYAFATSEIPDLDTFPTIVPMAREDGERMTSTSSRRSEYSHETEIIFKLPTLQMHLKTEHLQGENEPGENDPNPHVDCSFVTDFDDHIIVAMDAEVLLFLHDLVNNYVKDKMAEKVVKSPELEKKNVAAHPTAVLKQDIREFRCNTWHLEPTVRLISWAGKRIDPVGVDYILQRLGFQHARLTIPKWMQRGCMDPLDKILSLLVDKLILVLKEPAEEHDTESTM